MKKWSRILAFSLLVTVPLSGCSSNNSTQPSDKGKIGVVTTFYPLYELAKQVGGDHVNVINLVPTGVEPHDYEPTPQDVARMQKTNIFIYNGAGLEGWVDKIIPQVQHNGMTVVDATENIQLLNPAGTPVQPNQTPDPHVWLDPVLAQQEVRNIEKSLSQADPTHAADYQSRANAFIGELQKLDADYKQMVSHAARKDFITTHQAFTYLSKQYGLTQRAISGINPEQEPSPSKMAEVVKFAKEHNIHYIFFETLVSPKIAEVVAKEAGAQTLVLNPIEGLTEEQMAKGVNYLSLMKDNLQNLKKALESQ